MTTDDTDNTIAGDEHSEGGSAEGSRTSEEADLQAGVTALTKLSSTELSLAEVLTRVAEHAVHSIPGADGVGLTLIEDDRPDTIVATAQFVSDVDDVQYGLGEGPCITAARQAVTVVSGSVPTDSRWPNFARRVAQVGLGSALSLPLHTSDGVVGTLNAYAYDAHAFDLHAAKLAERFAQPAAVAVENAHILAATKRLVRQLQTALETQRLIDQAVGIIISRTGVTSHDALERLRALSHTRHVTLRDLAMSIGEEAAHRADARRAGS